MPAAKLGGPARRLRRSALLALLAPATLVAGGCVPAHRHPTWAIYPLQRRTPHDGLAVVNQPDGFGLHIWIDTDTSQSGVCTPRWNPDAARLFNGNGTAPFSSGLASREEFFNAMQRQAVVSALRRESEALCRSRDPRRSFRWMEPPRQASEVKAEPLPLLQEDDLLSDPEMVQEQEDQLLNPDQTNGSARRQ